MSKDINYLRNGCGLIAQERDRQYEEEVWCELHDDEHVNGELRDAAIAYLMVCDDRAEVPGTDVPDCWPWDSDWWKPTGTERNLVKAGALIAAELDRYYRAFQTACNAITQEDFGFECFDEHDDYDLCHQDWVGKSPQEFVHAQFAEDYARKAGDEEAQRLSDQYGEEEAQE